jgi:sulfofructose kinase
VNRGPRSPKSFDVVGFGFNTWDQVCVVDRPVASDTKQRLRAHLRQPGGQIPTALVALQRWGLSTAYVGPFGDDEGGELQRASLVAEGVDIGGCSVRAGIPSQLSTILVDRVTGARTVLWDRPQSLGLPLEQLDRALLTSGRALLMDADDIETAVAVAGWAKQAATLVVLDVDEPGARSAELLAASDVVIVCDRFVRKLTGDSVLRRALSRIAKMGPSLVVATLGAGGALACERGEFHWVDAMPVAAVDSTSAGDLFHAGCLYGLLQGWLVTRSLRIAAVAAALECTTLGGRAAIPTLQSVLQRL